MSSLAALMLLTLIACSQAASSGGVVIQSDAKGEETVTYGTVVTIQDYQKWKMPEAGASIIWTSGHQQFLSSQSKSFVEYFKIYCGGLTLSVGSQTSFEVFFNGAREPILSGDGGKQVYSVELNPQEINWCFDNKLEFVVKNQGSQTQGGLIYQLIGSQQCIWDCPAGKQCPCNCNGRYCGSGSNSFWNAQRCQCQCGEMNCQFPKYWLNSNTCRCECNKQCPEGLWLNSNTCECDCEKKKQCPPGIWFDMETCKCACQKQCPSGYSLNKAKCECECGKKCPDNFYLNPKTCGCECTKKCPIGFWLNKNTCECQCEKKCYQGFQLNKQTCQCECKKKTCSQGNWFDQKTCKCSCENAPRCSFGFKLDLDTCKCYNTLLH